MKCKELDKYDRGKTDEAEFAKHAVQCLTCREALRLDQDVLSLSRALRKPMDAPNLWDRIEESLLREKAEGASLAETDFPVRKGLSRPWLFASAAAVLIAVVCIGIYLNLPKSFPDSGLLTQKTLNRVEKKEREYLSAIQDLEKLALPQMDDLNLELTFLYRSRLETIDTQIEQCREALVFNPANARIRRHLMMALNDKKETLAEVLNIKN